MLHCSSAGTSASLFRHWLRRAGNRGQSRLHCFFSTTKAVSVKMRIPHSAVEEQNAEAGPSTPRSNGGSRHQQPSSQPGTSDDVAFARTAEFLNGLMHAPRITEYRKRETDELVERCYFNCWRRDTHLPSELLTSEQTNMIASSGMYSSELTSVFLEHSHV